MRARLDALDGLRGLAALIVVVFHFLSAFAPDIVPDQSATVPWWVDTPLGVLYNGTFSVSVFFALSGFVLAHASLAPRTHLIRDMALRYVRLAIPAAASTALAWGLLTWDGTATRELASIAPGKWLQWTFQSPVPTLPAALQDGLFDVFKNGFSNFNNVLWTMRTELTGSLAIYLFFQYAGGAKLLLGAPLLLMLAFSKVSAAYSGFALGALLCVVWSRGWRINQAWALSFTIAGLIIGSQARGFAQRHGIEGLIDNRWLPGNPDGLLYPIGATCLLIGVLNSATVQQVLRSRACLTLGKLSFPLYLVHVPLIYTAAARAGIHYGLLSGFKLIALFLAYLLAALLLAKAFHRCVDAPLLQWMRQIRTRRQDESSRP